MASLNAIAYNKKQREGGWSTNHKESLTLQRTKKQNTEDLAIMHHMCVLIGQLLGLEDLEAVGLPQHLEDGVILCKLVQPLHPSLRFNEPATKFMHQRENWIAFQTVCREVSGWLRGLEIVQKVFLVSSSCRLTHL